MPPFFFLFFVSNGPGSTAGGGAGVATSAAAGVSATAAGSATAASAPRWERQRLRLAGCHTKPCATTTNNTKNIFIIAAFDKKRNTQVQSLHGQTQGGGGVLLFFGGFEKKQSMMRSVLLLLMTMIVVVVSEKMECGEGVVLCGVLTLESGFGPGAYSHPEPGVHGLWPENGQYGDSACLKPESTSDPTTIYSCYEADDDVLSFEVHEWEKHGECAGVSNEEDFFNQVCHLAATPIRLMTDMKTLEDMRFVLERAGFEVFSVDTYNSQLSLSACSTPERQWRLAPVADFQAICGGWTPAPAVSHCPPNQHGPPCDNDADCLHITDCLRCANSGFCTSTPLPTTDH